MQLVGAGAVFGKLQRRAEAGGPGLVCASEGTEAVKWQKAVETWEGKEIESDRPRVRALASEGKQAGSAWGSGVEGNSF